MALGGERRFRGDGVGESMRFEFTGERALRRSISGSSGGGGALEDEATVGGFLAGVLRGDFRGVLEGVFRGVGLAFGRVWWGVSGWRMEGFEVLGGIWMYKVWTFGKM